MRAINSNTSPLIFWLRWLLIPFAVVALFFICSSLPLIVLYNSLALHLCPSEQMTWIGCDWPWWVWACFMSLTGAVWAVLTVIGCTALAPTNRYLVAIIMTSISAIIAATMFYGIWRDWSSAPNGAYATLATSTALVVTCLSGFLAMRYCCRCWPNQIERT